MRGDIHLNGDIRDEKRPSHGIGLEDDMALTGSLCRSRHSVCHGWRYHGSGWRRFGHGFGSRTYDGGRCLDACHVDLGTCHTHLGIDIAHEYGPESATLGAAQEQHAAVYRQPTAIGDLGRVERQDMRHRRSVGRQPGAIEGEGIEQRPAHTHIVCQHKGQLCIGMSTKP